MTPHQTVHRRAPAKINLALAVGPPRESDGMHPIASWMAPITLTDDVRVRRLHGSRASRYSIRWRVTAIRKTPIDWPITSDLGVRAHHALEAEVGESLPIQLDVEKRIPVGSGLGGGSSDAAATLLAVRELFELDVRDDRLAEIGHSLGSDVPFFLEPGAALVTGLGDEIERLETPSVGGGNPAHLLLVIPSCSCATGQVYKRFDSMNDGAFRSGDVTGMARTGVIDPDSLFNDLAAPAMGVAPELAEAVEQITECAQLTPMVTGSGSAMFMVFATPEARTEVENRIAAQTPALATVCVSFAGAE